jgi:hypothetical protein
MAKKSKVAGTSKLAKKYASLYKALSELAVVLEDLEDEDDESPVNRALTINYSQHPNAMRVEGWGRKFVSRLDEFDG